jgi:hypothetical protein
MFAIATAASSAHKRRRRRVRQEWVLWSIAFWLLLVESAFSQMPAGTIAGRALDPSGAGISGARIVIRNKQTGAQRNLLTNDEGDYSAAALLGVYDVTAEARGFQRLLCDVVVQAGVTTTVDLRMQVGQASDSVTVSEIAPQVQSESHEISSVIDRTQIEALPLNGRSFLELVKLEPGALQPTRASNNRTFVPLLGSPIAQNGRATRVTVDGGNVGQIGNGGTAMDFSQEIVQEFQVSTVNFDLSTGVTGSGSVNIVTRSGTNDLHVAAFYFFRNHTLSAYPGLKRDPQNPDPYFQRQQYGVAAGGPLRRDRLFFFGAFERNDQRGVFATDLLTPDFAALSRITRSPLQINQASGRLDFRASDKQSAFFRYSHEGIFSYGPTTLTSAGTRAYPSAWTEQPGWTDQSVAGLTSELRPNLVNELRFSYFFVSSAERAPKNSDCGGCIGIGSPSITVSPDLFIGTSLTTAVLGRRFHLNDIVAWQKSAHRIEFGGDWETNRGGRTDTGNDPVTMTLFSPSSVRAFNSANPTRQIPLPESFLTVGDILQLPVQSFTVGIGNPNIPQANFNNTRISPLIHLFAHDTWRSSQSMTVNYGLGWSYDAPLNYDLTKPSYLEPILGASGLAATQRSWTNFSPSLGFAWSPRNKGNTVIRGGAAIYYDFETSFGIADPERVSLGPQGVGRGTYAGAGIANPLADVLGVPYGAPLNFSGPTLFTGVQLLRALPIIQSTLTQLRGDPNNQDFSIRNIEADKQGFVVAANLPSPSSRHASIGIQRKVGADFVVSADFVVRQFVHLGTGATDFNHFLSAHGRVLPLCVGTQRTDPSALCSLGPISVFAPYGRARYVGLLMRAEKRFTRHWQLLLSYAYSSDVGNSFANGFDNDHPLSNYGPLDRDIRHILSFSGVVQLPRQFQLSAVMLYNSAPPFSAFLGGLDLNGDGATGDLLPGSRVGQFNRDLDKNDLRRLVAEFNQNYAGGTDSRGRLIPKVVLPTDFEFSDRFMTHDIRLSKSKAFRERQRLTLICEVFNLFNVANLSGRSGDLIGPGFGQASARATQVFGSGGPRSIEAAIRYSF